MEVKVSPNGENKIIELFEDDRGWIRWCENCGEPLNQGEVAECPKCHCEFAEIERV